MNLKITNNSEGNIEQTQNLVTEFFPYAKEQLGFDKPVSLMFKSDSNNAKNPLGMTGHYNPNIREITIYVDGRHPKDILRTFSHELVHHTQNCRGEFDNTQVTEEGYAQKNEHLRKMEKEAYLEGQIILRDWEDSKKGDKKMNEESLRELVKEVFQKASEKISLQEKTKTPRKDRRGTPADGTPSDRVKGRAISEEVVDEDAVDETIEEEVTEEEVVEEEKRGYAFTVELVPRTGAMKKLTTLDSFKEAERFATEYREKNPDAVLNITQITQEGKSVEEEETLTEWKNRSINKLLMEKWCK